MMSEDTRTVVVEYVGIAPNALSADQRAKLETFVESANAKDQLLGVRVFPNFDAVGDELPSGMVAIYSLDAPVDATLLSDDLFQMMAVARIDPPEAVPSGDEYFAGRLQAIQGAVLQQPPKNEVVREAMRNPKSNKDMAPWAPQLGGRGALAGVYSCVRDGDTRVKDYFLVARATLPDYVHDLKRDIAAKQPTFRELLYGDDWQDRLHYGKNQSRRNVCRILANLAEACAVEVTRHDLLRPALDSPDHAPPEMAVPDWEHASHSIAPLDWKRRPAVAVSYGVVPASECIADDHFFVVSNPYDGILRFPITNHEDVKQAIGLPIDTGRKSNAAALMGAPIPAERLRGVTWDSAQKHHPDLHQDAFKPLGREFKQAMRQMGWNPEHHPERLVPIAIKIAAPALE